jgi:hypothetical protein
MIRGRIAIPDVDPKTWRSRGRKRKQPTLASAIVTPVPMKKRKGPVIRLGDVGLPAQPLRSVAPARERRSAASVCAGRRGREGS